eukprot:gene16456-21807_t
MRVSSQGRGRYAGGRRTGDRTMAETYSTLLIERHADGYAVVTLNRPEALNALNS